MAGGSGPDQREVSNETRRLPAPGAAWCRPRRDLVSCGGRGLRIAGGGSRGEPRAVARRPTGLAHGRLGPGQVLLADGAGPKLDFTGVDAGFPAATAASRSVDAVYRDPRADGGLATDRAADLYSLGVLLVWLLTGRTDRSDRE